MAEAFTGLPSFTGFPDRPPTLMSSFAQADSVAATFAAMSAMFAIYERDQGGSGQGQVIDVSLYEPLFRLIEFQTIAYDQLGLVRERLGNRSITDSPRNAYATGDGRYITISAGTQKSFDRLVETIGLPELSTDERFTDALARQRNADVLDELIAGWFARHDFEEALRVLEAGEVVTGPILTIADIFADPQYAARENIVGVTDPDFGDVRMQNVAPRMTRTPGRVRHAGRGLGADNEVVYREELGLAEDEFERLRAACVI